MKIVGGALVEQVRAVAAWSRRRCPEDREEQDDQDDEAEDGRQRADVAAAQPVDVVPRTHRRCRRVLDGLGRLGLRGWWSRHGLLGRSLRRPMSPLRPAVMSSTTWPVVSDCRVDLRGHLAEVERGDAVGDLHDVVHVVRDEDDRRGRCRPAGGPGSSTCSVCATPSAAVGSSRMTSLLFHSTALGDRDGLALAAGEAATTFCAPTSGCAPTGPRGSRSPAAPSSSRPG